MTNEDQAALTRMISAEVSARVDSEKEFALVMVAIIKEGQQRTHFAGNLPPEHWIASMHDAAGEQLKKIASRDN
jgi:hypothetical protein